MTLFIISFIAGVLTVLAPCILPLLPVILAGSVSETSNRRRPFIIIGSLSLSVLIFTLLLKGSTALITISPTFWTYVSAVILAGFGLTLLFPIAWAKLVLKIPGHNKPDRWISKGYGEKESVWSDIVVGAALGPVFTTCSPTFFIIIATVLPQSLAMGIVDLAAYIIGLALSLLLIATLGQKLIGHLDWATNPEGAFRKVLGVVFILIAVAIATGYDKKLEANILAGGFFDVTKIEQSLNEALQPRKTDFGANDKLVPPTEPTADSTVSGFTPPVSSIPAKLAPGATRSQGKYTEFQNIAGYVNSDPIKLADFVGKKVILVDFIDYSCINCQRTFPYMNDWWKKYSGQGLEIIAIHTPEFAFEKDIDNVRKGIGQFGLKFPIVLDNSYSTWNAYNNSYWPHKYLIDIKGNVVYDHAGEGAYDETEKIIVDLLNERKQALGQTDWVKLGVTAVEDYSVQTASPETYFGSARNELFGNGIPGQSGQHEYTVPADLVPNHFYLGGTWDIQREYAQNVSASTTLSYIFAATKAYLVAQSPDGTRFTAHVLIDGREIPDPWAGGDVKKGTLMIDSSRLYSLYANPTLGRHRIDIIFNKPGVRVYTFTFG
jgi:cytochrome c biogenesis protein CcdA/thiol-disulfide isomerase/thioredoxin